MDFTLKYRSRIIIKAIEPFLSSGKKVLDIGCGNGVVSCEIEKYFNCAVTGTDILDYSNAKIDFKKMERGDRLGFGDREFDIGLFNDTLHHISFEGQIALVKEALRVCSDVLIFEVKPAIISRFSDYFLNKIHNPKMPILMTHRDPGQWMRLFREHNLSFKTYIVKKPSIFYPVTNYLFHITA